METQQYITAKFTSKKDWFETVDLLHGNLVFNFSAGSQGGFYTLKFWL